MRKVLKFAAICLVAASTLWFGSVLTQRRQLNDGLVRLHVVANSDTPDDQGVKLLVRDAVTEELSRSMPDIQNANQAKVWLQENLGVIQTVANETLASNGSTDRAVVTLGMEAFDTRYYDTFTLPAGVYDALRVTIGDGAGKNWWCVVFPTLCIPATAEGFADVAAGAGFPEALTAALEGEAGYELRFYLLDVLGRVENMFFQG